MAQNDQDRAITFWGKTVGLQEVVALLKTLIIASFAIGAWTTSIAWRQQMTETRIDTLDTYGTKFGHDRGVAIGEELTQQSKLIQQMQLDQRTLTDAVETLRARLDARVK